MTTSTEALVAPAVSTSVALRELGLGLVGAVIGGACIAWFNWLADKRRARSTFLSAQLEHLYGPLHYFTVSSKSLFELTNKVWDGNRKEFVQPQWSAGSQDHVKAEVDKNIELQNEYVRQATENNARTTELLEKNWSWIDLDDIDEFVLFKVHYTRWKTERGELAPDFRMHKHLGEISFLRETFVRRVEEKFSIKQKLLAKLN